MEKYDQQPKETRKPNSSASVVYVELNTFLRLIVKTEKSKCCRLHRKL